MNIVCELWNLLYLINKDKLDLLSLDLELNICCEKFRCYEIAPKSLSIEKINFKILLVLKCLSDKCTFSCLTRAEPY